MSSFSKKPILWLGLNLLAIAGCTALSPAEKTLGANARIVYLHGVWVWTAMAGLLAAGGVGALGLILRRDNLHRWSRALGRAGLLFWITYLPISMWAMQTSWNGLFLAEPRWRLAIIFAIGGLSLQAGVTLMEDPIWASAGNVFFILALALGLANIENVMHPPSPILNSRAESIQIYFAGLLALTMLAGWQITRWWHRLENSDNELARS